MALNADINVTPMIDVLLVLLIVFHAVHAAPPGARRQRPPPAKPTSHTTASPQVVLELKADGSYAINGTATPYSALPKRLRDLTEGGQRNLMFVKRRRNGGTVTSSKQWI